MPKKNQWKSHVSNDIKQTAQNLLITLSPKSEIQNKVTEKKVQKAIKFNPGKSLAKAEKEVK
jgi:hypothetical protein